MDPDFVDFEDVLELHSDSIREFGGTMGLRDEGSLRSAVGQPLNDYFYGHAALFEVAAAYAYHISQAQAFLDGNKRTAVATALAFLKSNDVKTPQHSSEIYDAMIGIAERRMSKPELADLFRRLFG
ncbi:MAG: type II toxin-antitoxin system death-on-curing family toxin [Chthoniobacterales bacterium]